MNRRITRWAILVMLAATPVAAAERQATTPQQIRVAQGFEVELLRSAQEGEDSWISMSFDSEGRLVVGLDSVGIGRLALDEEGVPFERIDDQLRHCRGVLCVGDSLYVSATDSNAIVRLVDRDRDGRYEAREQLAELDYRSRYGHGPNQLALGPDGMLYLVCGNDVSFPRATAADSPYGDPREDWVLPNPHDLGHDQRVGYIARIDPQRGHWEIIAGGFRNQVDVAFSEAGEMFTWDADMEWDVGLPWYRPTRINHVVPGGEYGWRWGTGKWPAYYADSLPSTLDTGLGSPTGLLFVHSPRFPARMHDTLLAADWQHGRMLLVDLVPEGASYRAQSQVFLEGTPLNIADMQLGPDGWLYFITGGRGSQSGLYRVRYRAADESGADESGAAPIELAPPPAVSENQRRRAAEAAQQRQQLIALYRGSDPAAVDAIWPHLGSEDRWLRFTARVALERQPLEAWRERVLSAPPGAAQLNGLLAMARIAPCEAQTDVHRIVAALPWSELSESDQLTALRVLEVSISRHGEPTPTEARRIAELLLPLHTSRSVAVRQEVGQLLVVMLGSGAIDAVLSMLQAASTQEEQIRHARTLANLSSGWSDVQAERYLEWLTQSSGMRGGRLVQETREHLRSDFVAALNDAQRDVFAERIARLESSPPQPVPLVQSEFVRNWTVAELIDEATVQKSARSIDSARAAVAKASCLRCHTIRGEGTSTGPDLTAVGQRFDERALLESIVAPSQVIDPKYQETAYLLTTGQIVTGRAQQVSAEVIQVETNGMTGEAIAVRREEIEEVRPAPTSPMPDGLLDGLTREEILDLLAYLKAGGDPDHPLLTSTSPRPSEGAREEQTPVLGTPEP